MSRGNLDDSSIDNGHASIHFLLLPLRDHIENQDSLGPEEKFLLLRIAKPLEFRMMRLQLERCRHRDEIIQLLRTVFARRRRRRRQKS
jgi:hypothetical protein